MKLSGLTAILREDPGFRQVADEETSTRLTVQAPLGVRPPLFAALAQRTSLGEDSSTDSGTTGNGEMRRGTLVVVTATTRDAENLLGAMASYVPAESLALFPAWETLPHERLSPRPDTVARRLATLRRLASRIRSCRGDMTSSNSSATTSR